MEIQHNVVGWFEIPVLDMDRAIKFYETVTGLKLTRHQMGPLEMAWFPWIEKGMGASGSLVSLKEAYKPCRDGILIYLTAFSGDVAIELSRVEAAGGKILERKKLISEDVGYMGLFIDPEGNRIALHSRK
jgi:predicted enzyme related to lactoylglutathione lyase